MLPAALLLDAWNDLQVLQQAPWLGGCSPSKRCGGIPATVKKSRPNNPAIASDITMKVFSRFNQSGM
ncbi:hypothetical protein [Rhizobium ruizarguesonis]|uniref:hypothetical protein n=1 Tax=Rhizobium ruizarguesonis TaxID=2081791 RepID=UPI00385778CB